MVNGGHGLDTVSWLAYQDRPFCVHGKHLSTYRSGIPMDLWPYLRPMPECYRCRKVPLVRERMPAIEMCFMD